MPLGAFFMLFFLLEVVSDFIWVDDCLLSICIICIYLKTAALGNCVLYEGHILKEEMKYEIFKS